MLTRLRVKGFKNLLELPAFGAFYSALERVVGGAR